MNIFCQPNFLKSNNKLQKAAICEWLVCGWWLQITTTKCYGGQLVEYLKLKIRKL